MNRKTRWRKLRNRYRAVLLDFDGVIFDSEMAVYVAVKALLEHHGLDMGPPETFRHRKQNHFQDQIDQGIPWSEEECRAFFYNRFDSSRCGLVPGAREMLLCLQQRRVYAGIVSAHRTDGLLVEVARLGIMSYFAHIAGGARHKRDALLQACEILQTPPAKTLFIGDILSDVLHGQEAGVTTVLYAPADSPHAFHAHHHITDLRQVIPLLES